MTLTRCEQKILDYVALYIDNAGYPPTRREIKEACGFGSLTTVRRFLASLVRKGYIRVPANGHRAIQIVRAS